RDGSAAPDAGIVYVVSASSPTFGRLLRVLRKPGTPAAGDAFGAALAAVGDSVLVGAPGDDTAAPGGGAAFVFGPMDAPPPPLLTLTNPRATDGDQFGFAVAAAGNRLLVGAPGNHRGEGVVFLLRADTGAPIRTFAKPTPRAGDRFGASIAVTEAGLVVGAP